MNTLTRYPWPVINDSDSFATEKYVTTIDVNASSERFQLRVVHDCNSIAVTDLIKDGNACYVTEVSCVATHFRDAYLSDAAIQEILIPAQELRGIVSVSYLVVVKKNVDKYHSSDFHPDYGGATFSLESGSVLAIAEEDSKFDAKKRYAGSISMSSYLTFEAQEELQGEMYLDVDQEKIVVKLPLPDHMRISGLLKSGQKDISAVIDASYAFPALVAAISEAFQNPESFQRKFWYQALKRSAKEKDIEWESGNTLSIVQGVLRLPATRASEALSRIIVPSDADDETI